MLKVRIDLCLYLVGKRVENTCVSHVKPRWVGHVSLVMIVDVSNLTPSANLKHFHLDLVLSNQSAFFSCDESPTAANGPLKLEKKTKKNQKHMKQPQA